MSSVQTVRFAAFDLDAVPTRLEADEIIELVPTPILGLAANLPISPAWNIDAAFTFFPLSEVTDYETECIDGQIRIGWTPTQDWELFLGARNHSVKVIGEQAGRPTEIDLQLELLEIGRISSKGVFGKAFFELQIFYKPSYVHIFFPIFIYG